MVSRTFRILGDLLRGKPVVLCGRVFTLARIAAFSLALGGLALIFDIGTRLTWHIVFASIDAKLCGDDRVHAGWNRPGSEVYHDLVMGNPVTCARYDNLRWWFYLPYDSNSVYGSMMGGLTAVFIVYLLFIIVDWLVLDRDEVGYELFFPTGDEWYRKAGR